MKILLADDDLFFVIRMNLTNPHKMFCADRLIFIINFLDVKGIVYVILNFIEKILILKILHANKVLCPRD